MRTIYPRLFWLEEPMKPIIARRGAHVHREKPWTVRLSWGERDLHPFATHAEAVAWATEQATKRVETQLRGSLSDAVEASWRDDLDRVDPKPRTIFDVIRDWLFPEPPSELIYDPAARAMHYDHVHWAFKRPEGDHG